MAKFHLAFSALLVIFLQRLVHASTVSPQSSLQTAPFTEESDPNIPDSLPLDNSGETIEHTRPWGDGAHPFRTNLYARGGSTKTMKSTKEGDTKSYTTKNIFTVNSRVQLPPPGKSNDISSSTKSRTQRIRGTMDYESIALALRLTCEVNRRLNCAPATRTESRAFGLVQPRNVIDQGQAGRSVLDRNYNNDNYQFQQQSNQHSYPSPLLSSDLATPINVPPSQGMQHPVVQDTDVLFHETHGSPPSLDLHRFNPRATPATEIFNTHRSQRKSLTNHVKKIADILEYDPIVPALALKILDQACSVETAREHDQYHNPLLEKICPYLTSHTVHKLYLAAAILANRAVRGELPFQSMHHGFFQDEVMQAYAERLTKGGIEISPQELANIVEWMFHSLGTEGLNISRSDVEQLLTSWKGLFKWEV